MTTTQFNRTFWSILIISSLGNLWSLADTTKNEACTADGPQSPPSSSPVNNLARTTAAPEYGTDISWPMQHNASRNYPWLPHNVDPENNPVPEEYKDMPIQPLGDRQSAYDEFMKGCTDYYHKRPSACYQTEIDRLEMSIRQPQSMVNFTEIGFQKIKAPTEVFKLIKEFWEANKDNHSDEKWGTGNTYVNHWQRPSVMVNVEDDSLIGGGFPLKNKIWKAAEKTISDWTGQDLKTSSLYGIRIYQEGAILSTHVDRLPLVSSCIINVDQDVDEEWPLEVIGHDGKAYNVTMQPGDMVLYESHSILHGRPFALKGRYFANVFIHFEPRARVLSGQRPSYVIEGSPEDLYLIKKKKYETGATTGAKKTSGATEAHLAAQEGDMHVLEMLAKSESDYYKLTRKDINGWTPLHEAARGGHLDVIKFLIDHDANINEKTNSKDTPLSLAMRLGEEHPIVVYLKSVGAQK